MPNCRHSPLSRPRPGDGLGIDNVLALTHDANGAPSTYSYYHYDGIGSVTELTDSTGALSQAYEYDAWGIPTIYDASETTIRNPYLFTGRRWDAALALYYYRARHYDPALGRFLQTDPAGYKQTTNLYAYCASNPTSYIDPLGLEWSDEIDWHHKLAKAVFEGTEEKKPFISELGLELADDVDIGAEEYGRIIEAPEHRAKGTDYNKHLKQKLRDFKKANPRVKVLTRQHCDQLLDSLDDEWKTHNSQGRRPGLSHREWRSAKRALRNTKVLKEVHGLKKQGRKGTGRQKTATKSSRKGSKSRRSVRSKGKSIRLSSAATVIITVAQAGRVVTAELSAKEYRETLTLQYKARGYSQATIDRMIKIRTHIEAATYRSDPAFGLIPNVNYDRNWADLAEHYLQNTPEDRILQEGVEEENLDSMERIWVPYEHQSRSLWEA